MGVYFTDETMPKSCVECKANRVHIKCEKWETIVQDISSRRADDCPLIEVKAPHGRLIDVDDANERIRQRLGIRNLDYLLEAEKPIAMSIKESPTVIESEVE